MAHRGSKGFTLIEVLVALVVASFILMIVMSASLIAKARQQRADLRERAVLAAAALIAEQTLQPAGSVLRRGKSDKLGWEVEEQEMVRDPRGFFVLDRIGARLFDAKGKLVFSASTRKLKELAQQ
jgi:prepilin-type N-terminal cleavage/methylation domain-containing protein